MNESSEARQMFWREMKDQCGIIMLPDYANAPDYVRTKYAPPDFLGGLGARDGLVYDVVRMEQDGKQKICRERTSDDVSSFVQTNFLATLHTTVADGVGIRKSLFAYFGWRFAFPGDADACFNVTDYF
jgi:hypothetical protein